MIGKIVKPGKSFGGCVRYVLQKHEAMILDAEGLRTGSVQHVIHDFNMQRKMNPELGQAVGHILLSWSIHDTDKLNAVVMAERAKEYLEGMKIRDTQYLIVAHTDKPHPHLHIIYNRVNNEAKTISDRFQKRNNVNVCKELTQRYGYYLAPGKEQVNRQQLKGADKLLYELYDNIKFVIGKAKSWDDFERLLLTKGITIDFKYRSGTAEIQGISFSKWGVKFKGSQIDRNLSYAKLNSQIEQNQQQSYQHVQGISSTPFQPAVHHSPGQYDAGHTENLWKMLSALATDQPDLETRMPVRKRKRKKLRRHL